MPLPTITSPNPSTTPAVAALTYGQSFLTMLHFVAANQSTPWQCQIKTQNYDAESGTLAPSTPANSYAVKIANVQAYAAEYPVLAGTLAAVLLTAGLIQDLEAANRAMAAATSLPDSDPKKAATVTAATSKVAAARQALGALS